MVTDHPHTYMPLKTMVNRQVKQYLLHLQTIVRSLNSRTYSSNSAPSLPSPAFPPPHPSESVVHPMLGSPRPDTSKGSAQICDSMFVAHCDLAHELCQGTGLIKKVYDLKIQEASKLIKQLALEILHLMTGSRPPPCGVMPDRPGSLQMNHCAGRTGTRHLPSGQQAHCAPCCYTQSWARRNPEHFLCSQR